MGASNIDITSIQKQELFASLQQHEIDFIISNSESINLPKNKLLFSSGEKASAFYILISGEIRVFKRNQDNREEEMARFTPGDTIGDFDFARGAEYDACAEAAEDSQIIVFPRGNFTMDSLAQEDPSTVCSILLNAIVMMTARIKATNRLILDNMSWVQDLHRRAYEDAGTGLWKQTIIKDEIAGSLNDPAALIMLKPDRFKILVDSNGHSAGDEAMIKIAAILKNTVLHTGCTGWPLRFKSNEVGIILNNCDALHAEKTAGELAQAINNIEPVILKSHLPDDSAAQEKIEFCFSATITWAIWSEDNDDWDALFQENYAFLLDNWKDGGQRIVHYRKMHE
jgi:diguanylate cyclase (GGDEF)-like protein